MQKENRTISNDKLAAIAIALYKYSESLYLNELTMPTINKTSSTHSPWSSKIFGLRQFPNK